MLQLLNTPVTLLTNNQLSDLTNTLNIHYRNGEAKISDPIYDNVYLKALTQRIPDHPLLTQIIDQPNRTNATINNAHPSPMLSTTKAYSKTEVEKWLAKVIKAGASLNLTPDEIFIETSSKYDGIAGRFDYQKQQLFTRGNGLYGEDISFLLKSGLVIQGNNSQNGIGEIVMKNEPFMQYFSKQALGEEKGFVDSRGFIAGIANSKTLKEQALKALELKLIELVIYKDMPRTSCPASSFMENYQLLQEKHLSSDYLLDGVIFDVKNNNIKKILGETSHAPRWRLALKKQTGIKETTINNIRWQVGRTQLITPILEVDCVKLSGVNVTSITGHSLGYIKKNQCGVNAKIEAVRSGQVIPAWVSTLIPKAPDYPKQCPCCNSPTYIRTNNDNKDINEYLMCSNKQCEGSTASYLFHAMKRLNINLFGKAACTKLIEADITTLEQIFSLNKNDFINAGFGEGQADNFMNEITQGKLNPLHDHSLLAALGIHLLGRGTSEKILTHLKISELSQLTYKGLLKIEGFADLSAKIILAGLQEKKQTLDFLLAQNFNVIHTSEQLIPSNKSPIFGYQLVFTGTMENGSRNDMEKNAKNLGAKIGKTVTSKTSILITGSKVGASKINAAKTKGVKVLTENEYISLLNI